MHYRSMILAALAILFLTGLGCSERDVFTPDPESLEKLDSPIVGGQPTADFEHAVALYHGSSFICSGTLVTPTAVVTAAHCLDNVADPLRVFFGVNALKPWKGVVVPVVSYEVHPQWDPVTLQNDIAIVILEEEVPIEPATLLGADQLSPENIGDKARFVGYGAV
ncbi:MAG: trypsin-like serine protease, partial [Myxococcota bacterium]|nr:trypsin-like serine protease [Myxococcota bacterium]